MEPSADFSKLRAMSATELELWARQLRRRWFARIFALLVQHTAQLLTRAKAQVSAAISAQPQTQPRT